MTLAEEREQSLEEQRAQLQALPTGFYMRLFEPADTDYYNSNTRRRVKRTMAQNQERQFKATKQIASSLKKTHVSQPSPLDGWYYYSKKKGDSI
jgi:hypothetical protein